MSLIQKSSRSTTRSSKIQSHCIFHPENTIHNFCKNKECLLPMCPTCVGIHSQEHKIQNSFGNYVNINEVIDEIRLELEQSCRKLQDFSEEYTQDYENKEKIVEECKRKFTQIKVKIMKQLENVLDEIELSSIKKLQNFQDRVLDRYKQIEEQIQYLYQSLKLQLNTFQNQEKILKNVILYHSQEQSNKIKEWVSKFTARINELKKQSIKIDVDPSVYNNFKEISSFLQVKEFQDDKNQYLLVTKRSFLSSDRKTLPNSGKKIIQTFRE